MLKDIIYVKENDVHESVLNILNDKDQLDKLIESSSFENKVDFKSGMMLGMSVLAMYISTHAEKIIVKDIKYENYLELISDLYKLGKFSSASSSKDFDDTKHDCVLWNGCLCIRGRSLDRVLSKGIKGYNRKDCINYLLSVDALKFGKDKHTVKAVPNFNGRFYAIKLESLDLEV